MKYYREAFFFGVSGVIGFVIDSGLLYVLRDVFGLYLSRLVSFLCAVVSTWVVNRNLTFKDRRSGLSLRKEFFHYLLMMLGGGLVNYAVYAALVSLSEFVGAHPVVGVAAGSLSGMVINLLSSRFLLYRFASQD